jgi:hypothetical protein
MNGQKRRFVTGWVVIGLACVLTACASTGPKPEQKTKLLDEKGAALGIPTPAWVPLYQTGGNLAVEALPEHEGMYCFAISDESTDKAFLLNWVNNLNGPVEIASVIATTVSQDVAARAGNIEGAERERIIRTNTEVMTNASYTGARKVADWWILAQNTATKAEYYQAFVLYTFDRQILNDQIARNMQNVVDNNAAMSAAERAIYADLINEIRVNGFANR